MQTLCPTSDLGNQLNKVPCDSYAHSGLRSLGLQNTYTWLRHLPRQGCMNAGESNTDLITRRSQFPWGEGNSENKCPSLSPTMCQSLCIGDRIPFFILPKADKGSNNSSTLQSRKMKLKKASNSPKITRPRNARAQGAPWSKSPCSFQVFQNLLEWEGHCSRGLQPWLHFTVAWGALRKSDAWCPLS